MKLKIPFGMSKVIAIFAESHRNEGLIWFRRRGLHCHILQTLSKLWIQWKFAFYLLHNLRGFQERILHVCLRPQHLIKMQFCRTYTSH